MWSSAGCFRDFWGREESVLWVRVPVVRWVLFDALFDGADCGVGCIGDLG